MLLTTGVAEGYAESVQHDIMHQNDRPKVIYREIPQLTVN